MSQRLIFLGHFTLNGSGATSLTVTCDVTRITRSDSTLASAANGASATEITTPNARGAYLYALSGADLTLYDYVAVFITAGNADQKHVPGKVDGYVQEILGAPAGASVSADIAAVAADLPQRITKNTALSGFTFPMVLSSDHVTGATGKTVTATRSIDGAAFGSCTNSVAEVSSGFYKLDLAAADLNGNVISFLMTATSCDPTRFTIVTEPT